MQFLVPAHLHDIVAVEKPIDLFPGEHEQALTRFRPAEFLLSQCLVVEDEAIVFPHIRHLILLRRRLVKA